MNTLYEAQIELGDSAFPPDRLPGAKHNQLPLHHVISRHRDGTVASHLGDLIWIWTAYHPRGKYKAFNFCYWGTEGVRYVVRNEDVTPERMRLVREMQFLMSIVIYRHQGRPLGWRSLVHYLYVISGLARYADQNALSIAELFGQAMHLDAFIVTIADNKCTTFERLLKLLLSLEPVELSFKVARPHKFQELQRRASAYRAKAKQTAPLPARIYSKTISSLTAELDAIEANADRLEHLLRTAIRRHRNSKRENPEKGFTLGPEIIAESGCVDYFEQRGHQINLFGLSAALSNIQVVCKLVIHVFSGMRAEEALFLPYHCLEIEKGRHGSTHCVIIGVTTKLERNGRRRTRWVTNQDGHRAIRIAQRFAALVYEVYGCTPSRAETKMDDFPLLISPNYLPWERNDIGQHSCFMPAAVVSLGTASEYLRQTICPTIEFDDIDELEAIDPYRAWRSETAYQIGQPWPLTTHQLRRSLALYAQRSGLVALSSLRRQLQHITKEMSLYYSNGSQFARNFIEDNQDDYQRHICKEWRDATPESAALAYLRDVVLSEEPLFGGAGNFIEQTKKRGSVMSREETMKRFKQGLLAYKANPLGGCTNPSECNSDKKGFSFLDVPCLAEQCKHLIAKESNLLRVIPYQQQLVETLDPTTVSYEMEKRELDALIKARDAIRATSKEKHNV